MIVTQSRKKGRQQALQSDASEQFQFDKRLLESALNFGNGDAARTCFDWVEREVKRLAAKAGFSSSEIQGLTWGDDFIHIGAPELRWKFRAALGRWSATTRRKGGEPWHRNDDEWFSEKLGELQIVVKNRMVDGVFLETPIARTNTVDRCIAYAVRIYILDLHGFRAAVKQCPFVRDPIGPGEIAARLNWNSDENIRRMPHWFLQWPITKQLFCTKQHAQTYRQRVKRQADARKHK